MKKKRGTGLRLRALPTLGGKLLSTLPTTPAAFNTTPIPPEPPPAGRLYTQCPRCKSTYRIGVAQLRHGRGQAQCQECQASFNVLDTLAETVARARAEPPPVGQVMLGRLDVVDARKLEHEPIFTRDGLPSLSDADETQPVSTDWNKRGDTPESHAASVGRASWGFGTLLLLALLAVQFGLFEGPRQAQNERLRPWLESLGCRLPVFRAPKSIQIVGHDLHPAPDGIVGYEFTLVLANQASLPQAFPGIKLILSAYNGSPVADRLFEPAEYLPNSSPALMPVGGLQEIRLLLAKPQREIGGFSFELL